MITYSEKNFWFIDASYGIADVDFLVSDLLGYHEYAIRLAWRQDHLQGARHLQVAARDSHQEYDFHFDLTN